MKELYELLINIGNILWLFYALSLLMFYYATDGWEGAKSSLISMIIVVLFNVLMLGYQGAMNWVIVIYPETNDAISFAWFMGFTGFDCIAMFVLYKAHQRKNIKIGRFGQFISVAFFAAANIQLLQYSEIVLFNTDQNMDKLYTIGIPTINISVAIGCFGLALLASYYAFISKKGLEGLRKWLT